MYFRRLEEKKTPENSFRLLMYNFLEFIDNLLFLFATSFVSGKDFFLVVFLYFFFILNIFIPLYGISMNMAIMLSKLGERKETKRIVDLRK